MSAALTTLTQNKKQLTQVAESERAYLTEVLKTDDEISNFKMNFVELASNDYLMKSIDPKEILITAVIATKLGLDINPAYNELYILPFNTKTGKKASIVPQLNGMQEMAYKSGFFLTVDSIWLIKGGTKKESEMSYSELSSIKKMDFVFIKDNFLGFDVNLVDISNSEIKIPDQHRFVGIEFLQEITNQLIDTKHAIPSWRHKAVRSAVKEMFIPRSRNQMRKLEEIEKHNETVVEAEDEKPNTPTQKVNLNAPKPKTKTIEAEIEEVAITIDDLNAVYSDATGDTKVKIMETLPKNWRELDSNGLSRLLNQIEGL